MIQTAGVADKNIQMFCVLNYSIKSFSDVGKDGNRLA